MLTVDETEENTGKLLAALGAKPHVAFRTRSVEAVRSLVATGAGIALLPDLVYRPWSLEGDRIEAATSRARCRWCRWAWSGGAVPACRSRRATSSAWRRRSGRSASGPRR